MKLNTLTKTLLLTSIATTTNHGNLNASEATSEAEKTAVAANSKFAFKLYHQLAKENKGKNIFFSPYSISSALTLAAEGASGNTKQEILTTLGYPKNLNPNSNNSSETNKASSSLSNLNKLLEKKTSFVDKMVTENKLKKINQQLEKITNELFLKDFSLKESTLNKTLSRKVLQKKQNKLHKEFKKLKAQSNYNELSLANSIWIDKSFNVKQSFINKITSTHSKEAIQLADFKNNSDQEKDNLNQWVKENTHLHQAKK